MKNLYLTFDEDKFAKLKTKKQESGSKNWEEFILKTAGVN